MPKYKILTAREQEIIDKKIKWLSLTQNESNILSKSIRPKLKEISKINASKLLNKLEYNQKGLSLENKIKKIIIENVKNVASIIIFGSAIQTNYKNYNDIDILIITKDRQWKSPGDKYDIITKLTERANNLRLNIDIQLTDKNSFYLQYSSNPSLIYQLKDSKIIYGKTRIPTKVELSKLDLRMKLDWSDIDDEESNGIEIYQSLRNVILVRLLLNKIVDNEFLVRSVDDELGRNLIARLKNNTASKFERKITLVYIKELSEKTDKEIKEAKWEKIVL